MKTEDGAIAMSGSAPEMRSAAWMEVGTLLGLLGCSLAFGSFASNIVYVDASLGLGAPLLVEWICRANVAAFALGVAAAGALLAERFGRDRGAVDRARKRVFGRFARDRSDESISRAEKLVLVRLCIAIAVIFVLAIFLVFSTISFIETGLMSAEPLRGWMTPGVSRVEMEHPDADSPVSFSRFGTAGDGRLAACRPRARYPSAVRDYVASMPGRSGILISPLQQADSLCVAARGCKTAATDDMIRMDPAIEKPGPLSGFALWACATEEDVAAGLATSAESSLHDAKKSAARLGPDLEYFAGEWCARAPNAASQDMELRAIFRKQGGVMVGSFALARRAREGYPLGTQNWVSRGEFYPVAEDGKDVVLREVSRSGTGTNWRLSLNEGSLATKSRDDSKTFQLNRSCRDYWQPMDWPPPN